jgi:hypothetical protein
MKKLLTISAILLFIFIHSSCSIYPSRIAYIPMNPSEQYPETSPDSVEIFITKLPIRPYEEMGIFYFPFRYNNYNAERSKLNIQKIKEMTAKFGANAVIRLDVTDSTIKGVTIRYK